MAPRFSSQRAISWNSFIGPILRSEGNMSRPERIEIETGKRLSDALRQAFVSLIGS